MFGMDPLLNMAALLFAGLLFSRLIKLLKLPNVTGFLVGGLIIGPSVLGLLSTQGVESLGLISSVALGFIAFSIGSEFKISYFRRVGFLPIVIATFESLFAVVFVVAALAAAGQTLPFSLVLGAIAAATAPAATIMVIKQYRAKGPVTETLLSVVALDDATALIFFGIAVAIAQALESPQHASLLFSVLSPVLQILAALGIGLALGAAHTLLIRFLPARHNRLVLTIAFVLTATAVAELLGLSALLTTMAMGAVFANFCKQCPGNGIDRPLYQPYLYDVFRVVRRGAEPFHSALNWAGGCNLCGGARAGQNGGCLVWRNADARAGRGAPLFGPGAVAAGGRCHWPDGGGPAGGAAICRSDTRCNFVRHADL